MNVKIVFAAAISLLVSTGLSAQLSIKTECFGSSSYWLDKGEDPREKIGNAEGSAKVFQANLNIPVSVKTNKNGKPIIWGVGVGGSYVSLDNKNFTENLVISEIVNIELGIQHIRPISDKWSLMAGIGGGIYTSSSEFSRISWKHVLGSMHAIFVCQVRPNMELGGGIAVNSTFGYPMAFPAMYLNWRLQGKFDFNLSMTNGLNIGLGLKLNNFLSLSLIGEMNGQMALLEKDEKDVMFTHQYMVTGLRPEIKIGKTVSIPLTAGINAMRSAYYSDRTLKAMFKSDNNYYFQISPYVSAGLTVNF
ncbi:hypothetical protein M2459_000288 [Parabacteroides sp. PF5-5]|uniref:DUF6268 family outer membrane beta-barrel protein n=1 Tax=unclassified Parabacteroides TaxID=2649774 RepID=UPI0024751D06|nr:MULTISPECIES: DUF6268 family outer membrane beta-barrel protein [unclassified Parabacteroides]MDH6303957.1 hypothetical protein [Parabacteroides sp. PH5-39]MDH6314573.1 hypothetical protein [Parabacteroides sp. PF5-13]MDH6318362.1 hypothetical protein [Parabacteroides sp. PH5-13]MDH6322346.1 hypothetical protein [Parabacteroides sp. PH5-8]MDH6325575.1 hypothetical protein [Parabacteroides sp. PH5-41]